MLVMNEDGKMGQPTYYVPAPSIYRLKRGGASQLEM